MKKKIETERKVLSRRRPPSTTASGSSRQRENALSLDEYNMQDMILKNRSKALKEDEAEINYDRDKLHRERSLHIRWVLSDKIRFPIFFQWNETNY